ncbi:MAG: AEC family transporter [Pseudomonadota bacterium]
MGALLDVILPVFVLIGFGYGAVRLGWFSDTGVDALMVFTQRFAVPCLLFMAIASLDLGQSFDLRLLTSFYTGATVCFVLGILGARFFFARPWEDCVAIGFGCLFSNSVLIGLPISERAYGAESLSTNFAIIAVHSPYCYFLGITAMEIARNRSTSVVSMGGAILKGMFSNPLVLGLALGFTVNLSGLPLPSVFTDALDMMVAAALPVAIFGIGGVLARYKPEGDLWTVAMVVGLSLLLHPLIMVGMGTGLGLDHDVLRSAVITAAMAPGINMYVFADMYGKARRVAATSVLVATALSVLSIWVWLQVLG